jgi:septin family protein
LERTVQIDVVRAGEMQLFYPNKERSHVETIVLEIEEKGFNVRLTVIDTPGFGDYVNNQDCWVPIIEFLDEQHQAYMEHEAKPHRKAVDDLRVHVCLYFIPASGHTYVVVTSILRSLCSLTTCAISVIKFETSRY